MMENINLVCSAALLAVLLITGCGGGGGDYPTEYTCRSSLVDDSRSYCEPTLVGGNDETPPPSSQ